MKPHRRVRGGQDDSDPHISDRREGPVEGRAHVINLSSVACHVSDGRRHLGTEHGRAEEVSKEFGTLARCVVDFAVVGKFLERVSPYRLEQPPATSWRRSIQIYQGLRD